MSKNQEPVKPVEPESDSSEEKDDEGSTEVSESEPEPTKLTKKPSPPPLVVAAKTPAAASKPPQSEPSGEEESGSESESESESDSDRKVISVVAAAKTPAAALKPPQPEASGEEESGSESESESESDSDRKVASVVAAAKAPSASKPPQPEESGSESESESESDTDGPNQKVTSGVAAAAASKPLQAEPWGDEESASNSDSLYRKVKSVAMDSDVLKSSSIGATMKTAVDPLTPSKRLAEENETDAIKSKKQKKANSGNVSRFQRLWSEEDEIVLINGMINYSENKGDPINDADAFLELIRNSLKIVNLTKTQLTSKMKRIKQKYDNNTSKKKTTFSNPHEQNAFDLSKILWGKKNVNKENRGKRKRASSVVKCVGVEDRMLMLGEQMFEEGILGQEWEKLEIEEWEAYMRQLDVKKRRLKLVMDNLN